MLMRHVETFVAKHDAPVGGVLQDVAHFGQHALQRTASTISLTRGRRSV
jgi:hypothetical protein